MRSCNSNKGDSPILCHQKAGSLKLTNCGSLKSSVMRACPIQEWISFTERRKT